MHRKDVVVIGGGPAGITFTRQFKKLQPGRAVTVFRPESHSMVYCAIPYAIEGLFDPGKVYKRDELVTETGESISLDPAADFVCFAVGMRPDVALFEGSPLKMTRDGIVVNSRMLTNMPDVYAAGDACTFHAAIDGKPLSGKLATNAVPMAKVAAHVVAGRDDEYPGFYNGAATCVEDWRVGATGFTRSMAASRGIEAIAGHGETTTLFPMMPGADTLMVTIVADRKTQRVIGGQILSTLPATDKVDVVTFAIQQGMTLKQLAKLSYSAQPWQSFFPARSAVVGACEDALDQLAAMDAPSQRREAMQCV